jgi:hypothetical protein
LLSSKAGGASDGTEENPRSSAQGIGLSSATFSQRQCNVSDYTTGGFSANAASQRREYGVKT